MEAWEFTPGGRYLSPRPKVSSSHPPDRPRDDQRDIGTGHRHRMRRAWWGCRSPRVRCAPCLSQRGVRRMSKRGDRTRKRASRPARAREERQQDPRLAATPVSAMDGQPVPPGIWPASRAVGSRRDGSSWRGVRGGPPPRPGRVLLGAMSAQEHCAMRGRGTTLLARGPAPPSRSAVAKDGCDGRRGRQGGADLCGR
jgi:hypothetical protein